MDTKRRDGDAAGAVLAGNRKKKTLMLPPAAMSFLMHKFGSRVSKPSKTQMQ